METNRCRHRARCDIVGSAESRQKVIERLFIRQIDNCQSGAPFVPIAVKNVVVSHGYVKQVARLDSLRVVIVIFRTGFRDLKVNGCKTCRAACGERGSQRVWGGQLAIAR